MSCGPRKIARAIHDLFVRLGWLNRSYAVTDLYREIFGTDKPSQAQRDYALRAAHAAGAGRVLRINGRDTRTRNPGEFDGLELGRERLQAILARPPLDPGKGLTLLRSASPATVSRASDIMLGEAKFLFPAFNRADERFKGCHPMHHSAISRVDLLHSHLVPLSPWGGFFHTSVRRRG
jgi:hypothetical protein